MRSARMTSRLKVQKPVEKSGGFGTSSPHFEDYMSGKPVAAELRRESGNGVNVNGERFSDYRAEYYIYWQHKICNGWRVTDIDTELTYTVTNVFPDRRLNLRRLVCERVNL